MPTIPPAAGSAKGTMAVTDPAERCSGVDGASLPCRSLHCGAHHFVLKHVHSLLAGSRKGTDTPSRQQEMKNTMPE